MKIAIAGKTNVGKSTIFNLLAKKKMAITSNVPGTTRDRKEISCTIVGIPCVLVDTAGLEYLGRTKKTRFAKTQADVTKAKFEDEMHTQMIAQALTAVKLSDVVIFVIDGNAGITEEDRYFADIIRKANKKVILLINKAESPKTLTVQEHEIAQFGFGDGYLVSGSHNQGFGEVFTRLLELYNEDAVRFEEEEQVLDDATAAKYVHIAILGRPNAGKSTMFNRILGDDRSITGDKPGITRDAISVRATILGREVKLIDTAGIRRATGKDALEKASIVESLRALRLCHVVVYLVDANELMTHQDLSLLAEVIEEGRCLVIAVNKCDSVEFTQEKRDIAMKFISDAAPSIIKPEVVFISSTEGRGFVKLYHAIFRTYDKWNYKITTSTLNKWLKVRTDANPPPKYKGKNVNLKYMTQTKIRPPTFLIFTNFPDGIRDSYLRYLQNAMAEDFSITGIPIRIRFESSGKNPYEKK